MKKERIRIQNWDIQGLKKIFEMFSRKIKAIKQAGKKNQKTKYKTKISKNQTQIKPYIIYCGVLFQNYILFNTLPA